MASISKESNGRRRIQFTDAAGKRQTLRLGKMNQRSAEAVKVKVEALVTASITGHIDDETARWVAGLDKAMSDKLSRLGLIWQQRVLTLGEFVSMYVASREDLKARTRELLEKAGENLVELFGKGKLLRDFTPGDADTFRQSLLNAGLAENTVRRRCGRAKQFFKAAMRQRLIPSNPFEGIACNVNENRSRFHFVSREDAAKVIEACPDQEWRVLFALARYGGLRCPSETLSLRWQDIDWQNQRMHVRSPKTEHHAGRESRLVPLFPELLPHLERAFELAEDGAEFVITRYRSQNVNLRTQLHKIIRRAGLQPWGKPWQNLRSTRETELVETFPVHVAAAWLGNTEAVAKKHYLQVTGEHFRQAVKNDAESDARDAGSDVKATQYPTSQAAASDGVETKKPLTESGVMRVRSSACDAVQRTKAPRGGLNPNRGFVELGAFRTKRLRRLPEIEMFKWNSISDQIRAELESVAPKRDRMRLALHYQSLLDSGEVETRADLARYLGVSRARVTQVLRRLDELPDSA